MDQGENGILVFALYNKIYEDDEDYYSYPIQAVDQGENGILVFALYYKIYEDDEEYYSYPIQAIAKTQNIQILKRQLNGYIITLLSP